MGADRSSRPLGSDRSSALGCSTERVLRPRRATAAQEIVMSVRTHKLHLGGGGNIKAVHATSGGVDNFVP